MKIPPRIERNASDNMTFRLAPVLVIGGGGGGVYEALTLSIAGP